MRHESGAGGALTVKQVATALAHETRWRILRELMVQALPVTELARRLGLKVGLVSRHMGILRRAGVVERGLGALYSIRPALVVEGGVDLGPAVVRLSVPGEKAAS